MQHKAFAPVIITLILVSTFYGFRKNKIVPEDIPKNFLGERGEITKLFEDRVLDDYAEITRATVILKADGNLLTFDVDGIESNASTMNFHEGDVIQVVRYHANEDSFYELIMDARGKAVEASINLYPWILEEKTALLNGKPDSVPDNMNAAAACGSKYKWPFMEWEPNKLTSGYGHCGCAYHAVDFNRGAGNDDCEAAVLNPARGIVKKIAYNSGGYGWYVDMDHGGGYWTRVGHGWSDPNEYISVNNDLLQGTFLMKRGSTGKSTSCHTHLEFWKDTASLPLDGFSCYNNISVGGTYNSYQTYVRPPKGNP